MAPTCSNCGGQLRANERHAPVARDACAVVPIEWQPNEVSDPADYRRSNIEGDAR
jgi:hypothetical protein